MINLGGGIGLSWGSQAWRKESLRSSASGMLILTADCFLVWFVRRFLVFLLPDLYQTYYATSLSSVQLRTRSVR